MCATFFGNTDIALRLIDSEAYIEARDGADVGAIVYAAMMGRTDTAKALIDAGADVNVRDKDD